MRILVGLLALAGCGKDPDPAWLAAADAAIAEGTACVERGVALTDQCADAMVGAATPPTDPFGQLEACQATFGDAREGLDKRPDFLAFADLNESGRDITQAIDDSLSTAAVEIGRLKGEVRRLCDGLPEAPAEGQPEADVAAQDAAAASAPPAAATTGAPASRSTSSAAQAPAAASSNSGRSADQRVLSRLKGQLGACLGSGTGDVALDVAIGADGGVTGVSVVEDTIGGDAAACLKRTIERARFPAGVARTLHVPLTTG